LKISFAFNFVILIFQNVGNLFGGINRVQGSGFSPMDSVTKLCKKLQKNIKLKHIMLVINLFYRFAAKFSTDPHLLIV
jgi:hypothetical protein